MKMMWRDNQQVKYRVENVPRQRQKVWEWGGALEKRRKVPSGTWKQPSTPSGVELTIQGGLDPQAT